MATGGAAVVHVQSADPEPRGMVTCVYASQLMMAEKLEIIVWHSMHNDVHIHMYIYM